MPKINIDEFDKPPAIGEKVTVTGTVQSINKATGDVEVSYDLVSVGEGAEEKAEGEEKATDQTDEMEGEESESTGEQGAGEGEAELPTTGASDSQAGVRSVEEPVGEVGQTLDESLNAFIANNAKKGKKKPVAPPATE